VCGEELNDKNERKGEDASKERGRKRTYNFIGV
jgi:hypothetical protein